MIIIINKWKKKLVNLLAVLVMVLLFAAVVPVFSGLLSSRIPVFSGWFQDEQPTGNPMRVEKSTGDSRFEQVVDQFVIKLQEFYYEEKN